MDVKHEPAQHADVSEAAALPLLLLAQASSVVVKTDRAAAAEVPGRSASQERAEPAAKPVVSSGDVESAAGSEQEEIISVGGGVTSSPMLSSGQADTEMSTDSSGVMTERMDWLASSKGSPSPMDDPPMRKLAAITPATSTPDVVLGEVRALTLAGASLWRICSVLRCSWNTAVDLLCELRRVHAIKVGPQVSTPTGCRRFTDEERIALPKLLDAGFEDFDIATLLNRAPGGMSKRIYRLRRSGELPSSNAPRKRRPRSTRPRAPVAAAASGAAVSVGAVQSASAPALSSAEAAVVAGIRATAKKEPVTRRGKGSVGGGRSRVPSAFPMQRLQQESVRVLSSMAPPPAPAPYHGLVIRPSSRPFDAATFRWSETPDVSGDETELSDDDLAYSSAAYQRRGYAS